MSRKKNTGRSGRQERKSEDRVARLVARKQQAMQDALEKVERTLQLLLPKLKKLCEKSTVGLVSYGTSPRLKRTFGRQAARPRGWSRAGHQLGCAAQGCPERAFAGANTVGTAAGAGRDPHRADF